MKKKHLLKTVLIAILGVSLIIPTYGCKSKDKAIVVAENMKEDLNSSKSEILKLIEEGNTYLESEKFSEARTSYEKAISKDKTNENIYLEIKDTYMKAKRFDDAYYIIKLAIDNNVSKDSMTKILEEIKSNFSVIQLEDTINQGDDYSLPSFKTIPVDTISNSVNIQWTQKNVDTSKPGVFNFDGSIDEYGRKVQMKLTIKEVGKQTEEVVQLAKEVTKQTNEDEKTSNKTATPQQKIENNDLNGDYYLKNGDGNLTIVQQGPSSIKFSISGRYSEKEFIDSAEGVIEISNNIAQYVQPDDSVIIFQRYSNSFLVTKFDENHVVTFQGVYLEK